MATSKQGTVIAPYDIRPGRNRSGSAIARNLMVMDDIATNGIDSVKVTTGDTVRPVGVAMGPIANGENGDICKRGNQHCIAGGVIAAGVRIAPMAGGKVQAAVAGDISVGRSLEDFAAADNDVILCELDCINPVLLA